MHRSSAWHFGSDSLSADELVTFREQGKAFYSDDDRLVAYQLNRDEMVEFPRLSGQVRTAEQ